MRVTPYKPKDFNDFWKNRIGEWLLNGVDDCVKNKINIGGITLIFCYIDFLGSLLQPNSSSRTRFYYFIEKYLFKYNKNYVVFKCELYKDYRCGLVHEAIMKRGTGIFRSDDRHADDYIHLQMFDDALWLDLIQLNNDFQNAAKDLKSDIDEDEMLKENAIKRLKGLKWSLPKENLNNN